MMIILDVDIKTKGLFVAFKCLTVVFITLRHQVSEDPSFRLVQEYSVSILERTCVLHFSDHLQTHIAMLQCLLNILSRRLVSPCQNVRNYHEIVYMRVFFKIHSRPMSKSLSVAFFINVSFEFSLKLFGFFWIDVLQPLQIIASQRN